MGSKTDILRLYKAMLRGSQKFASYNYKNYAVRKVRDSFKENKALENWQEIEQTVQKAKDSLRLIERQAAISQMYKSHKLVIENNSAPK